MLCDLNVVWPEELSGGSKKTTTLTPIFTKTLTVVQQLGYTCVALNVILTGKLPANYQSPINVSLVQSKFPSLKVLSRVTLVLDESSQHQNFTTLYSQFDLVAVRPLTEKGLQSACSALEVDIISLDVSKRLPFYLRHRTVGAAIERGIKFEIAYGSSTTSADGRRHVITNAAALVRATRSRGIIITSEARSPYCCRGPYDVTNLATIWGLDHMRARDSIGRTSELVVKNGQLRQCSYKQVIQVPEDVIKRQQESDGPPNTKKQKT
jgi:ribonuclease P/MRP protein subunit RPP1